jgi:hypothetical protein
MVSAAALRLGRSAPAFFRCIALQATDRFRPLPEGVIYTGVATKVNEYLLAWLAVYSAALDELVVFLALYLLGSDKGHPPSRKAAR